MHWSIAEDRLFASLLRLAISYEDVLSGEKERVMGEWVI